MSILNPRRINPEDEVDLLDPDAAPQDQAAFTIPEDDQVDLLGGFDATQDVGSSVSDIGAPSRVVYLSDVNQTVGYPSTMTDDEVNDAIQTGVYDKPRIGFFRMAKEYMKVFPQGAEDVASMTGSLMRLAGKNLKENAEAKVMLRNPMTGEPWLYRKGIHITTDPEDHFTKLEVEMDKQQAQTLIDWGTNMEKYWREQSQSGWEAPDPELFRGSFISNPSWNRAILTGIRSVPAFALGAAISIKTGQPLFGAMTLGVLGAAPEATAADDAGKDMTRVNQVFTINAVTQTLLELIPLRFIKEKAGFKFSDDVLKALKERVGIAAGGAVREGVIEEGTSQLVENLVAKLGYDKSRRLFDGYVESVIGGVVSGGAVSGITAGIAQETEGLQKEALNKGITQKELDTLWDAIAVAMEVKAPEINKIMMSSLETNRQTIEQGGDPDELFQSEKPGPRRRTTFPAFGQYYMITNDGESVRGDNHASIVMGNPEKFGISQQDIDKAREVGADPLAGDTAMTNGAMRIVVRGSELNVNTFRPFTRESMDKVIKFVEEKGLSIEQVYFDLPGAVGSASYSDFIKGKIKSSPSDYLDIGEELYQAKRRPKELGEGAYVIDPQGGIHEVLSDHVEEVFDRYWKEFGISEKDKARYQKALTSGKDDKFLEQIISRVFRKEGAVRLTIENKDTVSIVVLKLDRMAVDRVAEALDRAGVSPKRILFESEGKSGQMDYIDFLKYRFGKATAYDPYGVQEMPQKSGAPGQPSTFEQERQRALKLLQKHGIEKVTVALVQNIKTPTGTNAYGSYVPGERLIKLISQPLDTSGYHEAFHALVRMAASRSEINAAIESVMEDKKITRIEAEEVLADQFAEYARNQEAKGLTSKVKALFNKVLAFIQKKFGEAKQGNEKLFNELLNPTQQAPAVDGLPSRGEAETDLETGSTGEGPESIQPKKVREPRPLLGKATEVQAEKPVGKGEEKKSSYFERTKKRLATLKKENVTYSEMNQAENAALASRFVEEQPEAARRVAMGIDPPPAGVTDIAVSIAYEEYLRDQGKSEEFGRVAKITTLKGTRFGQEIVSFKGAVNEHTPDRFIKQVLLARMEQSSKALLGIEKGDAGTRKTKVRKKITERTDVLKKALEKQNLSITEAQKVLDSLIC